MNHKIIHITDLHCTADTDHKLMAKARSAIDSCDPSLILCTGDLVIRSDESTMARNYTIARHFLDSLACKELHIVPGNHDYYDADGHTILPVAKEYWKADSFVTSSDGLFAVGINSAKTNEGIKEVSKSAGTVGDASISFVESNLRKAGKEDCLVFCLHHHLIPMFNDTYSDDHSELNLDILWNAGKLLRVLRRNRVDLVLQGHKHDPEMFMLDDCVFLVGGSLLLDLPNQTENSFCSIEVSDLVTIKIHLLQSEREKVIHCRPNKRFIPEEETGNLGSFLNM